MRQPREYINTSPYTTNDVSLYQKQLIEEKGIVLIKLISHSVSPSILLNKKLFALHIRFVIKVSN